MAEVQRWPIAIPGSLVADDGGLADLRSTRDTAPVYPSDQASEQARAREREKEANREQPRGPPPTIQVFSSAGFAAHRRDELRLLRNCPPALPA